MLQKRIPSNSRIVIQLKYVPSGQAFQPLNYLGPYTLNDPVLDWLAIGLILAVFICIVCPLIYALLRKMKRMRNKRKALELRRIEELMQRDRELRQKEYEMQLKRDAERHKSVRKSNYTANSASKQQLTASPAINKRISLARAFEPIDNPKVILPDVPAIPPHQQQPASPHQQSHAPPSPALQQQQQQINRKSEIDLIEGFGSGDGTANAKRSRSRSNNSNVGLQQSPQQHQADDVPRFPVQFHNLQINTVAPPLIQSQAGTLKRFETLESASRSAISQAQQTSLPSATAQTPVQPLKNFVAPQSGYAIMPAPQTHVQSVPSPTMIEQIQNIGSISGVSGVQPGYATYRPTPKPKRVELEDVGPSAHAQPYSTLKHPASRGHQQSQQHHQQQQVELSLMGSTINRAKSITRMGAGELQVREILNQPRVSRFSLSHQLNQQQPPIRASSSNPPSEVPPLPPLPPNKIRPLGRPKQNEGVEEMTQTEAVLMKANGGSSDDASREEITHNARAVPTKSQTADNLSHL